MATLREIKRRIDSVKSTSQITKAMKMVAAAKLRRVQQRLVSTRPYAGELGDMLKHVAKSAKKINNPLLAKRIAKRVCFVLMTGDKGLCGSFNTNLIKRAEKELAECTADEKYLITIGKKGYDYFRKHSNVPILAHYSDIFNQLEFNNARVISSKLQKMFTQKKFDQVLVIYSQFINAVQQEITKEQYLPVTPPKVEEGDSLPQGFVYEPHPEVLLDEMLPMNLNYQMWRILLENGASEFGARMTAMETASDNAAEMIKELVLYYNKARQASITGELLEIVAGAEALKG